jgi:hypothetical protein
MKSPSQRMAILMNEAKIEHPTLSSLAYLSKLDGRHDRAAASTFDIFKPIEPKIFGFYWNSRGKPPHFHPEGRRGRQANIREPNFDVDAPGCGKIKTMKHKDNLATRSCAWGLTPAKSKP